MGFKERFAGWQLRGAYVRFGSKADMEALSPNVCFTPKADIG
jgi:hypothetical protein